MRVLEVRVPEPLSERDVKIAIEAFTRQLVSLGKAAEIAETPIQEFLVELRKRGIPAYLTPTKKLTRSSRLDQGRAELIGNNRPQRHRPHGQAGKRV